MHPNFYCSPVNVFVLWLSGYVVAFCRIYEGRRPVLMVQDPELLKCIFVKNFQDFPNRRVNVSKILFNKKLIFKISFHDFLLNKILNYIELKTLHYQHLGGYAKMKLVRGMGQLVRGA